MRNKIIGSLTLFLFPISLLFSCRKEEVNKELGQYAVAISHNGDSFLQLHFIIDGKDCGSLSPAPNINPSYLNDCSALSNPNELTNVFVLKNVIPGDHTVEVRTASGNLVNRLAFQMQNKECVFQNLDIEFK